MTDGFDKVFVAPRSMVFDQTYDEFSQIRIERFDDCFFKDIHGYNNLMLSVEFYERFAGDYEYMLIHQGDAYLFKPELGYWCEQGWDYVGAPWYFPNKLGKRWLSSVVYYLWGWARGKRGKMKLAKGRCYNLVGNGGLSLRSISKSIAVLNIAPKKVVEKYKPKYMYFNAEDVFWGQVAPTILPSFKVPDWRTAIEFGFEFNPKESYELIGDQLPMGCHKPWEYDAKFWSQYIPALTQEVATEMSTKERAEQFKGIR